MKKNLQSRFKDFIFSLILLSSSLIIIFFVCEIILRVSGHHGAPTSNVHNIYPVSDPILDWRRTPNSKYKEGRIIYKYNNSGFRDINHEITKPLGIQRIVVLGDSVTEGYGVEFESVFAPYLQSRLGNAFEVINIAAVGLNIKQELHIFKLEGLAYQPDLVILNFVLNDCDFYTNYQGISRHVRNKYSRIDIMNLIKISVNPQFKQFLKSFAFLYFMKQRLEDLMGRLKGVKKSDYYTQLWGREENRRKVTSGFDELLTTQKEHGFDIAVIVWPLLTDYSHYKFNFIHKWISEEATKRGFLTIDLLSEFSKIPYRALQVSSVDSTHPSALGHKIAVEVFLRWFRAYQRQT